MSDTVLLDLGGDGVLPVPLRFSQSQTHVKRPFVSKDVRKRELQLEKDRQRKRAAYAKQKAELEEYKAALKDRSTAKSDDNCNCSLRLSETQIFKSNSFRKKCISY